MGLCLALFCLLSFVIGLFISNIAKLTFMYCQVGEAEKLVKTLFQVAISRQPSVIFMDEVCTFSPVLSLHLLTRRTPVLTKVPDLKMCVFTLVIR